MEEQFFVLFQRYKRVVEKEAHKVSHEKGDVHDIVMDIMLYAHKKYTEGKYQMDGPFEVWLRHLAARYITSKYWLFFCFQLNCIKSCFQCIIRYA